jgi:hypothetical protein
MSIQNPQQPQKPYISPVPPVSPVPRVRPRQHRSRVPLVAALLILTCLVGVGALFGSHFFDPTGSGSTYAGTIPSLSPNEQIVKPPLTPAQLSDIMHLSGYMK